MSAAELLAELNTPLKRAERAVNYAQRALLAAEAELELTILAKDYK